MEIDLKCQRKAKVTDADIQSFMDPNRSVNPTVGKCVASSSTPLTLEAGRDESNV